MEGGDKPGSLTFSHFVPCICGGAKERSLPGTGNSGSRRSRIEGESSENAPTEWQQVLCPRGVPAQLCHQPKEEIGEAMRWTLLI